MPDKICTRCRHLRTDVVEMRPIVIVQGEFIEQPPRPKTIACCTNDACATDEVREMFPNRKGVPLDMARSICDREHDGHFVYFEPKDPEAGAASTNSPPYEGGVAGGRGGSLADTPLVQITRTRRAAAGGAR